jgi:WD40 repeat protein
MKAIRRVYCIVLLTAISGCGDTGRVKPIASVAAHASISSITFTPSGSTLATAGGGSGQGRYSLPAVILHDIASLRIIGSIPIPERIQAISFSPDGKSIAVADGDYQGSGNAYLFDPVTGNLLKTFRGSTGWIHGLAFSPDGGLLVSCGSTWHSETAGQGYRDGKIAVREIASGRERGGHEWEDGTYKSVSFAPNGQTYATGGGTCFLGRSDSGEVHLWDATTGRTLWSRQGHSMVVECVAFAPGGEALASGGMDGVLKLWCAADGKELLVVERAKKRSGRVLSVAFSPDGKYLLAALGSFNRGSRWGELRAWEIRAKVIRELLIYDGPSPVTCAAFSPDGRLLAAGDDEGTLRLWQSAQVSAALPRE